MDRVISFVGLLVFMAIAFAMSNNRRKINWRLVGTGVLLQVVFALLILRTRPGRWLFELAQNFVTGVLKASDAGAQFIFGDGFKEHYFAFSVLPTIIFVSAITAVAFHLGLLQWVVKWMARAMVKVMDVSGSEALAASANVFVGQTEAPLLIKPYLKTMTKSELMAMMTGGMATVAGGVMAAYVQMGADAGHLLAASIMSAPASLAIAKMMMPEIEASPTKGNVTVDIPKQDANLLDAACRGAGEGLQLALNVAAMLIAFLAIIKLMNMGFALIPSDGDPVTLESILGVLFQPIAFIMGIPWGEASQIGSVLGQKTIINEFIAYQELTSMKDVLSERSFNIATYALCGFANFSSIAIQIGGIGGLCPSRRGDFAKQGFRAMIGGTLAAFMTATIAGMII